MVQLDRKWRFVTDDNFNTSLHKAHDVFADTLRYLLIKKEALQKEIQKIMDEDVDSYGNDLEE